MEILLKPDKKKLSYEAGQFAIVKFSSINGKCTRLQLAVTLPMKISGLR